MTKEQHYSRNENQMYKHTASYILNNFASTSIAYFHQLGYYDGDESNLNNKKMYKKLEDTSDNLYYYYPFASFEYTANQQKTTIISNSLIVGTFNFVDPSESHTMHWAYDVIPYLIWGNDVFDNSTVAERFAWDKGSIHLYNYYRSQRGDTLTNHGSQIGTSLAELINQLSQGA